MAYIDRYQKLKGALSALKDQGFCVLMTPYRSDDHDPFLYGHIIEEYGCGPDKRLHILYVQYDSPINGDQWKFSYEYVPSRATGSCCHVDTLPIDKGILTPERVRALFRKGRGLMYAYGARPYSNMGRFIKGRSAFEKLLSSIHRPERAWWIFSFILDFKKKISTRSRPAAGACFQNLRLKVVVFTKLWAELFLLARQRFKAMPR